MPSDRRLPCRNGMRRIPFALHDENNSMTPVIPLARARSATNYAQLVLPLLLLPAISYSQSEADTAGLVFESATESHRGFDAVPLSSEAEANDAIGRGVPAVEPDTGAALAESGMDAQIAGNMPVPADSNAKKQLAPRDEPVSADTSVEGKATLRYDSVLENYELYEESDGPTWIEANDAVGQIGGWRTYARELYEPDDATDQDAATVEPDTGVVLPESEMGAKSAGDMATPVDLDATQTATGPDGPVMADTESQRVATVQYNSVLETYDPYEETDGPNWIEANDAVGKIGGWRTYARELYESDSDEGETQ